MVKFGGEIGTFYQISNKKRPLQNRTNVQTKGGGGSKAFWTMFKKTALFWKEGIPKYPRRHFHRNWSNHPVDQMILQHRFVPFASLSSSLTICSSCGKKENRSLFSTSLKAGRCEYTGCWDLVGPLSRSKGDWATIYQLQTITCLLHNILQNLYRFSPKSLWPYKRGALLCLWWVVLQVARLASTLNGVCQYGNLDLIR